MIKKIGLLTLPLTVNYGGILQAASLYHYLEREGYEVILIERGKNSLLPVRAKRTLVSLVPWRTLEKLLGVYDSDRNIGSNIVRRIFDPLRPLVERIRNAKNYVTFYTFIENYLPKRSRKLTKLRELGNVVDVLFLDAIVVGSDQVWRLDYLQKREIDDFFLGFSSSRPIRRIAYAASFGVGRWTRADLIPRIRAFLAAFDAVSCRESSGVSLCEAIFERPDTLLAIDPTLLIEPSFFLDMVGTKSLRTVSTTLEYILDCTPSRMELLERIRKNVGDARVRESIYMSRTTPLPEIESWVRSFFEASYVITDSYHGLIFSIIFRKNFIAIVNSKRGNDRFISILEYLGLMDRLVNDDANDDAIEKAGSTPIDFDKVSILLEDIRDKSRRFLETALLQRGIN